MTIDIEQYAYEKQKAYEEGYNQALVDIVNTLKGTSENIIVEQAAKILRK